MFFAVESTSRVFGGVFESALARLTEGSASLFSLCFAEGVFRSRLLVRKEHVDVYKPTVAKLADAARLNDE
jgi:hypothetical protein